MTAFMTGILTRLFGRLPIGWLQLIHNRTRFAAAISGVAFANILIFMQLGFLGALISSIGLPYQMMNADILVMSSDANTLSDGSPLPRQRMFQALATTGVADATAVYYARVDWKQPDGTIRMLDVFGIDPAARAFRSPAIHGALDQLKLPDVALIDRRTRNVPKTFFSSIDAGRPYQFEAVSRTLTVIGTFEIGGGFGADGYLVVSDQTFLRLFKQRVAGAPNFVFVNVNGGADINAVIGRLSAVLPATDTAVRTVDQAIARDQTFQTTQKPIGVIFGFGVIMGTLVGIIIVYQVLSTDVADHLKEYATFKAIGYPQRFFLGIVFEEALILAVFGFIPGVIIASGLYSLVAGATGLPITMPLSRPFIVLVATLAMCMLSGTIATRRLARADPAELF
jgi:putative ABC transport system permease protein